MRARYILVVDDERPVREMISFTLRRGGFEVAESGDAESARLSIAKKRPDLMLIDWRLPRMSGFELIGLLRQTRLTQSIPIIMITARAEEQDRVNALDHGADDYLVKPFSARELFARISALLRRVRSEPRRDDGEVSTLVLDAARQSLNAGEQTIQLSPMDFRLLEFFMTYPERVHNRAELLVNVWGGSGPTEERTVDVQIRRLRKALEQLAYDRFIQTVRGAGYRFSMRVD
jgi:two-component system, OmpR family, phosphate regulon response regulator PhoB